MSQTKKFDRSGDVQKKLRGIGTVPAANVYEALRSGPQFGRSFEIQPGLPIDGSKTFLRLLSPFTISLVPPLVFESALDQASNNSTLDESSEATPSAGIVAAEEGQLSVTEIAELAASGFFDNFSEENFQAFEANEGRQFLGVYESTIGFGIRELSGNTFTGAGFLSSVDEARAAVRGTLSALRQFPDEAEFFGLSTTGVVVEEGQASVVEITELAASGFFDNFSEANFQAFEANEGSQFLGVYESTVGFGIRELSEETFTGAGFFASVDEARAAARGTLAALRTVPSEAEFFGLASEVNGEEDRVNAEMGLDGPTQSRNATGEETPTIGILESTGARHSSFAEAKAAREAAVSQLIGIDVGGAGRSSISAETYVSLGVERQNDRNSFQEPGFADRLTAGDIAAQLQTMLEVPPLTLLINPTSMSIQYTSIQQFSQRTRKGYVFQRWGEEQPVMSVSGTIGAFVAGVSPDAGVVPPEGGLPSVSGVQFASKRDSASFQNLMSLLTFYKNAGYIYDTVGNTNANLFVGALAIDYDQWTHVGQFNSFSFGYDENENQNGKITFELEFAISQMYDNHQPVENVLPLNSPTMSPSDPRWVGQTLEPTTDLFQGLGLVDEEDRAQAVSPEAAAIAAASETSSMDSLSTNDQGFEIELAEEDDIEFDDGIVFDEGLEFFPDGTVIGPDGEVVALGN